MENSINTSSSTTHINERSDAVVEKANWQKEIDELQVFLASKASTLHEVLKVEDLQAFQDLTEEGPVLMDKIRDLEKLQQGRLHHIEKGEKLTDLNRKIEEGKEQLNRQEQEKHEIEHTLGLLAHQQLEAQDRLATEKRAARRHVQHTLDEDLRLDERRAGLDVRQKAIEDREASLTASNEALNKNLLDFADRQQEERRKEEENRMRSAKITRRLDVLADYKSLKGREAAELVSRYDALRVENDDLKGANKSLHERVANLQPQLEALAHQKSQTDKANSEFSNKVTGLNIKLRDLESKIREQEIQLSQLSREKTSLQGAADKSTDEAEITRIKLTDAQARDDNLLLLETNSELKAAVESCEAKYSDIDQIRNQVLKLQDENNKFRSYKADVDAAKRLQDSANAKIKDLEQEREEIRQTLDGLRDHVARDMDTHTAALARKDQTLRQIRDLFHSMEAERDNLKEDHAELVAKNDRLTAERDGLEKNLVELVSNNHHLTAELDELKEKCAALERNGDDLLTAYNDNRAELQHLTRQLQSCHCSDSTYSRKRNHVQTESEEEDESSTGLSKRRGQRLGKAPESMARLNTPNRPLPDSPLAGSASPELQFSRLQGTPNPADQRVDNARPLMNTGAPRALGTTNTTVTPSDGAAFTISLTDFRLCNFSSDVIPNEVIQTLRRKARNWTTDRNVKVKWSTVQSLESSRSCVESRLNRQKSSWANGHEYCCALCEKRMRLCIVVCSAERVLVLPRKAAKDEEKGPADVEYWIR